MTASPPVSAGFIVYRPASDHDPAPRFLMMRSSDHGTWGVPKGHLEVGEDIDSGARRETEEETGLAPDELQIHDSFHCVMRYEVIDRQTKQPAEKAVHLFLARVSAEVATRARQSDEHDEIRWVDLDTACELARYDLMKNALRQADTAIREQETP